MCLNFQEMEELISRKGTLALRKRKSEENSQTHKTRRLTETEDFPVHLVSQHLLKSIAEKVSYSLIILFYLIV